MPPGNNLPLLRTSRGQHNSNLYWRFATLYFFYFAIGGALLPFWTLYLTQQGFNSTAIGKLMSIFMATRIIAPSAWSFLAYYSGQPILLARIATLLTWISLLWIFWSHSFISTAIVMALFSFFWFAALPQFEIATLNHLHANAHLYSTIRLWGSMGFIVTVISLGQALEQVKIWIVPVTMLIICICLWLTSLTIPESNHTYSNPTYHTQNQSNSFIQRLSLLSASFMMQVSHAAYYLFYTSYLLQHGYSSILISRLWALAVIAEVGLLLIMPKLLFYFGARRILILSLFLAALRWCIIGTFPDVLWILSIAQLLHAATFGAFHASAIYLLNRYFPDKEQILGQTLYSSLSFGAGGALGSLISGYLWAGFGATIAFNVAAAVALIGAVMAWNLKTLNSSEKFLFNSMNSDSNH